MQPGDPSMQIVKKARLERKRGRAFLRPRSELGDPLEMGESAAEGYKSLPEVDTPFVMDGRWAVASKPNERALQEPAAAPHRSEPNEKKLRRMHDSGDDGVSYLAKLFPVSWPAAH